jgi:hypothetical protein
MHSIASLTADRVASQRVTSWLARRYGVDHTRQKLHPLSIFVCVHNPTGLGLAGL